jgi:hypothetical protein
VSDRGSSLRRDPRYFFLEAIQLKVEESNMATHDISSFTALANTEASRERVRIEPGKYRATCTAVRPPAIFQQYSRWYIRVDFAIHDDGVVVSKYINLGTGKEPNIQLGPRSEYFKLWTLAVGRKPEHNESMESSKIIGTEFTVTVVDKEHKSDGGIYSQVEAVSNEPVAQEALASSLTLLSSQKTPVSPLGSQVALPSSLRFTQVPEGTEGQKEFETTMPRPSLSTQATQVHSSSLAFTQATQVQPDTLAELGRLWASTPASDKELRTERRKAYYAARISAKANQNAEVQP